MGEKSVNKTVIINILSTVILQGIAFFSTPYFSRVLGTEQFGVYSVYNSWVLILTCVMGFGVTSSLATGRYNFEADYYGFRTNLLVFTLLIGLGLFVIYSLVIRELSVFLGFSIGLMVLLFFTALARSIITFAQEICIYEKRPMLNLILSCCVSVVCVAVSVLAIKYGKYQKSIGRIYGASFPYIVISMICSMAIFGKRPGFLKKEYCIYGIVVGGPIVFHLLGHNILSQADRIVMEKTGVSNSDIGVYSLYWTVISALRTVLNATNTSWCPFYYDDLKRNDWGALSKKCKNYLELFTALTISFVLVVKEVGMFMGDEEYWEQLELLPIMSLPVYFTFLYQFPVNFEFYNKKTSIIAMGTVGTAIINIAMNIGLVLLYGMKGAIIASVISYMVLFVFHMLMVRKIKVMEFHLKLTSFLPGLGAVCLAIICSLVLHNNWLLRWGIAITFGVIELIKMYRRKSIF